MLVMEVLVWCGNWSEMLPLVQTEVLDVML